jgi:branched-chain amino acid transport system permease protein
MTLFLQLIVNGLIAGSIYALASLGYALTFSVNVNNFAHGALIMSGGYLSYLFIRYLGVPIWISPILLVPIGFIVGLLIFQIAIKPFRALSSWSAGIVTTLALGIIIENTVLMVHGSDLFSIRDLLPAPKIFHLLAATFNIIQITLIVISLAIAFLLFGLIRNSGPGRRLRAVADDRLASEAMGINTDAIVLYALILGTTLALVSGFLLSLDYDQDASIGTALLIKAYTATVIGGAYDLHRVVMAAFALGILENLIAGYVSTQFTLAGVFLVLIAFLILKKEGLGTLGLRREV